MCYLKTRNSDTLAVTDDASWGLVIKFFLNYKAKSDIDLKPSP